MGNHEYCTECGLSSFHRGEPCPPQALKKHQAEQHKIEVYNQRASLAAGKLADKIKEQFGVDVEVHDFGLKIWKYQLVKGD